MILNLLKISFLDLKRRKLDFLRLSLILGVGFSALFSTLSLKQQLVKNLDQQAKYLLTSDLTIGVRRAFTQEEIASFEKIIQQYPHQQSRDVTLLTLIDDKSKKNTLLPVAANIKLVDHGYPFYSKAVFAQTQDNKIAWQNLQMGKYAYISQEQAERFNLKLDDKFQILDQEFELKDFIVEDAAMGLRFFALFPTIYVSLHAFDTNKIFKPQITFYDTRHVHWLTQLSSDQQQKIKNEIEVALKDPGIKVSLPADSSEQNKRLWDSVSDFLGILTLSALVLSILGLFTLMRYQWSIEVKNHQRFFLLGLTNKERLFIKGIQTHILYFFCILLSLILSFPTSFGLLRLLPDRLQQSVEFFNGDAFLVLSISLWFVLVLTNCYFFFSTHINFNPLVSLKNKKNIFLQMTITLFSFVLAVMLGRLLTRSWFIAITVLSALALLYVVLILLMKFLLWMFRKYFTLPHKMVGKALQQIQLRLIYRSWQKNFSLYAATVGCLGLVYFLLILLLTLQVSLQTQLTFTSDKPDLFLFDLQPEDLVDYKKQVFDFDAKSLALSPLVRGRLIKINDQEIGREKVDEKNMTREEEEEMRFKFRSVNVSYKTELNAFEKIVQGNALPPVWKNTESNSIIPISLENRYAKRMNAKIGDFLTFDFQGLILKTQVVNLRYVFWLSMHPNFFILFPDGVLNSLPQSYLSVLKFTSTSRLKDFISMMQLKYPHVSQLLLKQTTDIVMKQIDLLLKAFVLIAGLFLIMGIFLWLSVVLERLNLAKVQMNLFTILGIPRNTQLQLYLLEFLFMLVLLIIFTPLIAWGCAYLLAQEYFDGLLVWPWLKIGYLTIILVVPLSIITYFIVRQFDRIKK